VALNQTSLDGLNLSGGTGLFKARFSAIKKLKKFIDI